MIDPKDLFDFFKKNKINNFIGVPDSLLKHFCFFIDDNVSSKEHFITANEGSAVSLAAGIFLGSKKISIVYMQNSGLGNAINPLLSLADESVYSIPMLLMIGWRGEPGIRDEPQHIKQGEVTEKILKALKIPYVIIDSKNNYNKDLSELIQLMKDQSKPVAILVKKDTFLPYDSKSKVQQEFEINREDAIKMIVDEANEETLIISTTGMASRELYDYRKFLNLSHKNDFLTVGSMGHSSLIALGISIQNNKKDIICIDGDGSLIMHMGNLGLIGQNKCKNFTHIVLNNGAHDSVGGQPTLGFKIDIPKIALACGYEKVISVNSQKQVKLALETRKNYSLIEIKVNKGNRTNIGRPNTTPIENKEVFMKNILKYE